MKHAFKMIFVMGLLLLQYQNCAQHNDPSLFGVKETPSLDQDSSDASDVILESPVGAFDVSVYDSMISIGGNCQTGASVSHFIELKLQDSNNQPILLRSSISCPDCYSMVNARCEHGRYNAVIPVECAAYRGQTSSLYRLLGQLVTRDAQGVETRANTAVFDRFLQIAWQLNACPI